MAVLPSEEYWIRRSEATLIANERRTIEYEKELRYAYQSTMKRISDDLHAFFQRYATETGLDYADVQKRLTPKELTEFKKLQEMYLQQAEYFGANPKYKALLKDLSAVTYVSKIQEIQANIRHELEKLNAGFNKGLGETLKDSYEDSFYKTIFDIQKQAGFGVKFTKLGEKSLIKAIETPWLGESYSDRIWKNKDSLLLNLSQLIPQEFVRGRGPSEIAKDIEKRLGVSYNNAVRLARTELNYVSTQGSIKAYKESGVVEQYQFSATLDNRTSDICREMDGKVFDVSKGEVGINLPPMHPYCRSTTIPYFPDDEFGDYIEDRVARDESGNTYKVGKNVTYQEWAKEHASHAYVAKIKKEPKKHNVAFMNKTPAQVTSPSIKTLENFAEHNKKWEETTVLPRINLQAVEDVGKVVSDIIEDNDFCMRVSPQALKGILKDGVFKNQFETGNSKGLFSPVTRSEATKNLFGADTSKMVSADYEKYGYLGLKDSAKELKNVEEYYTINRYGGIIVKFKRSAVEKRTTFTLGDSLDGGAAKGKITAGDTKNPRANGVTIYDIVKAHERAKKYLDGSNTDTDPFHFADDVTYGDYFEIQYHGKLILTDVESISVLDSYRQQNIPSSLEKAIKDSGIVYNVLK